MATPSSLLTIAGGGNVVVPYGQEFAEWKGVPTNYADAFVRLAIQFRPDVDKKLSDTIILVSTGAARDITFPMRRVRLASGHVVFDAAFGGRFVTMGPGMFQPCEFHDVSPTRQIARQPAAASADVERSFAIVRFYDLDIHNKMQRAAPAFVKLPTASGKMIDAGSLVAMGSISGGRAPAPAQAPYSVTDIAWVPTRGQITAHGIPYLTFKDALSEEVMRFFSGGRYVSHVGLLNLQRVTDWKFDTPQTGFRARL